MIYCYISEALQQYYCKIYIAMQYYNGIKAILLRNMSHCNIATIVTLYISIKYCSDIEILQCDISHCNIVWILQYRDMIYHNILLQRHCSNITMKYITL